MQPSWLVDRPEMPVAPGTTLRPRHARHLELARRHRQGRLRYSFPHQPEGRSDLVYEEIGLLERSEVAALVQVVPVLDIGVPLLGPTARHPKELFGKDGAAGRDGNGVHPGPSKALPIEPTRG